VVPGPDLAGGQQVIEGAYLVIDPQMPDPAAEVEYAAGGVDAERLEDVPDVGIGAGEDVQHPGDIGGGHAGFGERTLRQVRARLVEQDMGTLNAPRG